MDEDWIKKLRQPLTVNAAIKGVKAAPAVPINSLQILVLDGFSALVKSIPPHTVTNQTAAAELTIEVVSAAIMVNVSNCRLS